MSEECPICFYEMEGDWSTPCCGNNMHNDCFKECCIEISSCPLCRSHVIVIQDVEVSTNNRRYIMLKIFSVVATGLALISFSLFMLCFADSSEWYEYPGYFCDPCYYSGMHGQGQNVCCLPGCPAEVIGVGIEAHDEGQPPGATRAVSIVYVIYEYK